MGHRIPKVEVRQALAAAVIAFAAVACGSWKDGNDSRHHDASTPIATAPDAGPPSPEPADADAPPATASDATASNMVAPDAAAPDATAPDAGASDASVPNPDPPTGVVTIAGSGAAGYKDQIAGAALFDNPANVIRAPDGSFLIADYYNGAIRRLTVAGVVSTVAAPPRLSGPFGMGWGPDGSFYFTSDQDDLGTTNTPMVSTVWRAGPGGAAPSVVARDVGYRFRGVAVVADGRLVLADPGRNALFVLDPATGASSLLAGTVGTAGFANGSGMAAQFRQPLGLTALPNGDLLVVDAGNHSIRRVTLAGSVTTYAGNGSPGTLDGALATATFTNPSALIRDARTGTIYVLDQGGTRIRRISPQGNVAWVAGTGTSGFLDNADPRLAQFYGPEGGDISADGRYLFLVDGNHGQGGPYHRIRRVDTRSFVP